METVINLLVAWFLISIPVGLGLGAFMAIAKERKPALTREVSYRADAVNHVQSRETA